MATATLTAMLSGIGSVAIRSNGWHVGTWRVTAGDGVGPVPAAEAVLAANGWTVGEWEQISGGITGGQWIAHVEPAAATPDREETN